MATDDAVKDTAATDDLVARNDTMAIDEAEKDTAAADQADDGDKAGKNASSKNANTMEEDAVASHGQHGTLMGQPRSCAAVLTTEIKIAQ